MEWKGNPKYLHEKKFFSVLLSPKMEVRLTLDSKKALSNFKRALLDNGQDAPASLAEKLYLPLIY